MKPKNWRQTDSRMAQCTHLDAAIDELMTMMMMMMNEFTFRDVFEDNLVEAKAKAKAGGLRGRG